MLDIKKLSIALKLFNYILLRMVKQFVDVNYNDIVHVW